MLRSLRRVAIPRAARAAGAHGSRRRVAVPAPRTVHRGCQTFVSSHFRIDDGELEQYLQRKSLVVKRSPTHFIIKFCPLCPRPHRNKPDNTWKLYVRREDGAYFCHRCGAKGSVFDLKKHLGDGGVTAAKPQAAALPAAGPDPSATAQHCRNLLDGAFPPALRYLTGERGLKEETLRRYGVGAAPFAFRGDDGQWRDHECLVFPWLIRSEQRRSLLAAAKGQQQGAPPLRLPPPTAADESEGPRYIPLRWKVRGVAEKRMQRVEPRGAYWGLFGYHTVPSDASSLVVTEGEFDAMAVHQATGLPAVSLPNGCRSLPLEVLPLLEPFERIYLWMDDDVPGREGAEQFAKKLGQARCFLVRPPAGDAGKAKDANDALLQGLDLQAWLDAAAPMPHDQILTFRDVRDEVFLEFSNPVRRSGVQCEAMPSLNRLLKGHRRGELTIFTGPTGSGKTTLLSQLSVDYARQGVNTLWGSFEIKNTRLLKRMVQQHAFMDAVHRDPHGAAPLPAAASPAEEFARAADDFEQLPLYFMRFFGSTDVDKVLEAMEFAVYAYDVEHVVLDNLNFMMSGQGRGYDKFEAQERALDRFRKFATHNNVHLTLVIHPRKEPEDVTLSMSSVFGTAKATQESDNVLILQNVRGEKTLEVRKNRFDGTLGAVALAFDEGGQLFSDMGTTSLGHGASAAAGRHAPERQRYSPPPRTDPGPRDQAPPPAAARQQEAQTLGALTRGVASAASGAGGLGDQWRDGEAPSEVAMREARAAVGSAVEGRGKKGRGNSHDLDGDILIA